MIASELVKEIENLIQQYGDIEVRIDYDCHGCLDPQIRYSENEKAIVLWSD